MQGSQEAPKAPLGNNARPLQPLHHRTIRTNINFQNSKVKLILVILKYLQVSRYLFIASKRFNKVLLQEYITAYIHIMLMLWVQPGASYGLGLCFIHLYSIKKCIFRHIIEYYITLQLRGLANS